MGAQRGMETESGEAREMGEAEVAGKVAVASGEGATLGHFCQDVDEVVQP